MNSAKTIGIIPKSYSKIIFVSMYPSIFEKNEKLVDYIKQVLNKTHFKEDMNPNVLKNEIIQANKPDKGEFHVQILEGIIGKEEKKTNPYDMDNTIHGCYEDKLIKLCFYAREFDYFGIIKNHKLFAIVSAVYIIFVFIAWRDLIKQFVTDGSLHLLSIDSLIQHSGFDFGFAFILFDFSLREESNCNVFTFLYAAIVVIYITMELGMCSDVWKAKIRQMRTIAPLLLEFYTKAVIYLGLSFIAVKNFTKYRILSSLYLFSPFIPQILHTASSITRKTKDIFFVITLSISRIIFLVYFMFYDKNIYETSSPVIGVFILIYFLLQVGVIIAQNIKGTTFFIPQSHAMFTYDYRARSPPDCSKCSICLCDFVVGDDTMVTPCGHYFHADCLKRWYSEEPICPVCRASLPDMSAEIN